MAQTIALQRGTGTINANGTTDLTLFTQSGGTATRVIVNQFTFYTQSTTTSRAITWYIGHSSSGGYRSPLLSGYVNTTNAGTFVPGQQDGSQAAVFSTSFGVANWTWKSDYTSTGTAQGANLPSNNVPQFYDAGGYQSGPSNFWIGPSDSLILRMSMSGSITANVGWSFTTITES